MAESGPDPDGADIDIRPVVASPPNVRSVWLFAITVAFFGALLFFTLEARRASSSVALLPDAASSPSNAVISAPPALSIPAMPATGDESQLAELARRGEPYPRVSATYSSSLAHPALPMPAEAHRPASPATMSQRRSFLPSPENPGPAIIYSDPPAANSPNSLSTSSLKQGERVIATQFQNPATTIPKGTIIQAVLETALDSNHAGYARALVSIDVFGFDGTRILVPKGSRLIGEYKANLSAGQNRALIQWQRLMRPDGVMIDLDSPSADPLGRAGLRGKVDSHFFERFAGSILQSTLDIGGQLAARSVSRGTVVFAFPGNAATVPAVTQDQVQRTLTVRQGTSVSVFVARDLDFTSIGS